MSTRQVGRAVRRRWNNRKRKCRELACQDRLTVRRLQSCKIRQSVGRLILKVDTDTILIIWRPTHPRFTGLVISPPLIARINSVNHQSNFFFNIIFDFSSTDVLLFWCVLLIYFFNWKNLFLLESFNSYQYPNHLWHNNDGISHLGHAIKIFKYPLYSGH